MPQESLPMTLIGGAILIAVIFAGLITGCSRTRVEVGLFGRNRNGSPVKVYTLRNPNGMEVKILNYGGTVQSVKVPDQEGHFSDVVLGFDDFRDYEEKSPYFGSIVGRYGNRIANGTFSLEGKNYSLAKNNNGQSLHGGNVGFDKVMWEGEIRGESLVLTYLSKAGEEGYPGNLKVTATYTLNSQNELHLRFEAHTDEPTICNLTGHTYFNLSGSDSILRHQLEIFADGFNPVDPFLIPTGEILAVEGTSFDFRSPHEIGERIGGFDTQLLLGKGYDHNWVIQRKHDGILKRMAKVTEPESGRILEVFSTDPGIQFYSGNFLDGTLKGKNGKNYPHRSGFCLEPQHFPNSPNVPEFPTTTLLPGQTYTHQIVYRFSTVKLPPSSSLRDRNQ